MATLNPNLKDFWRTRVTPDDEPVIGRVLYGGRMSSKSHDAAGVAIARANFRTERVLCTRMYQNRIADSVYTLLKDKIYAFGLEKSFKIYADAIEHVSTGSLFRFYGIQRNVDEIKSFEGATIWWNEESHNLTESMFTTIRPTIMRNEGAEMWFTLNPRYVSDYSWKRLIATPPKGFLVRQINYDENPFLGPGALKDIADEFAEDYELADHVYNGVPLDDNDGAIIKRSWVLAAIDAHLKLDSQRWDGPGIVGYDVADDGDDKNATTVMIGRVCCDLDEWKAGEDELDKSAMRARNNAKKHGALFIGYDSIGVGAGTGTHLRTAGWSIARTFKFNAGEAVFDPDKKYANTKMTNKEMFANLKAQSWWMVADMFRNTYNAVTKGYKYDANDMISIDSTINKKLLDQLVEELSTPRKDFDNSSRVKVESKKDLKKREVDSPNIADSFIIANSGRMMRRKNVKEWL